jgi:hypothetical protein
LLAQLLQVCLIFLWLQLTDVDLPYGKAPTAQLAEKLTGQGPAAKIFEGPKEMVMTTQVDVMVRPRRASSSHCSCAASTQSCFVAASLDWQPMSGPAVLLGLISCGVLCRAAMLHCAGYFLSRKCQIAR